jgi:hypothetical protein
VSDPTQSTQPSNWFNNVIGAGLVLFLCAITFYLTYKLVNIVGDIPQNLAFVCGQLLGFLTAKLSTAVDWSFGGSSSQKRQGEIIATQASTAATLATTAAAAAGPAPADKTINVDPGETAAVHANEPKP